MLGSEAERKQCFAARATDVAYAWLHWLLREHRERRETALRVVSGVTGKRIRGKSFSATTVFRFWISIGLNDTLWLCSVSFCV